MIPLIPGRFHQKRGAGDSLVFRRREGETHRTRQFPNHLVYIGPHPDLPHLALFKSTEDPNWFYWDIPENFIPLDTLPQKSLVGGFRAVRPAETLWGRKGDRRDEGNPAKAMDGRERDELP
ncbi:hypothetical protein HY522_09525 [bacterium]|nr:hypothetical protein [bacterium]